MVPGSPEEQRCSASKDAKLMRLLEIDNTPTSGYLSAQKAACAVQLENVSSLSCGKARMNLNHQAGNHSNRVTSRNLSRLSGKGRMMHEGKENAIPNKYAPLALLSQASSRLQAIDECSPSQHSDDDSGSRSPNPSHTSEVASGRLVLLPPQKNSLDPGRRVVVRVYRTSREHFAAIYPDKLGLLANTCTPIGIINLRNCTASCTTELDNSRILQINQGTRDGFRVAFRIEGEGRESLDEAANSWLDVFQSSTMACASPLSTVTDVKRINTNATENHRDSKVSRPSTNKNLESWPASSVLSTDLVISSLLPILEEGDEE